MSAREYRVHPAARDELDAAGERYDDELAGLSLEFFDVAEDVIDLISERPSGVLVCESP